MLVRVYCLSSKSSALVGGPRGEPFRSESQWKNLEVGISGFLRKSEKFDWREREKYKFGLFGLDVGIGREERKKYLR